MPVQNIDINLFLKFSSEVPLFDVRSPSEYKHAHIPGAHSLPIFTDEERKEIGTQYKQISREVAIKTGLRYFGKNLESFVLQVEQIVNSKDKPAATKIRLHCWRGGMRSSAMAWLLSQYGYDVYVLEGGYKQYRRFVLRQFEWPFHLQVLGGHTGSGKTEVLQELRKSGHPVIDLENLAQHKGSAFGALGMAEQPSQEQFENLLERALAPYYAVDNSHGMIQPVPIWIENESQRIGHVNLPNTFFRTIQESPCYQLTIPFEQRLQFITQQYGSFEKEKLVNAIMRIQKRLGGQHAKEAIFQLLENNITECFRILLTYYDKEYNRAREKNNRTCIPFESHEINAAKNASRLIHHPTH